MVNVTALALAATAFKLIDFQGRAVDLTNGVQGNYVPVTCWESVDTPNQKWLLSSARPDGSGPYQIVSNNRKSMLSYPSAKAASRGTVNREQAVAHEGVSTAWSFFPTSNHPDPSQFRIVLTNDGFALTSWGADPNAIDPTNPISLQVPSDADTQQVFTIQTIN